MAKKDTSKTNVTARAAAKGREVKCCIAAGAATMPA